MLPSANSSKPGSQIVMKLQGASNLRAFEPTTPMQWSWMPWLGSITAIISWVAVFSAVHFRLTNHFQTCSPAAAAAAADICIRRNNCVAWQHLPLGLPASTTRIKAILYASEAISFANKTARRSVHNLESPRPRRLRRLRFRRPLNRPARRRLPASS